DRAVPSVDRRVLEEAFDLLAVLGVQAVEKRGRDVASLRCRGSAAVKESTQTRQARAIVERGAIQTASEDRGSECAEAADAPARGAGDLHESQSTHGER